MSDPAQGSAGAAQSAVAPTPRSRWLLLAMTFWIGFNLRASVLGVPPILSLVRSDLHLTYTELGLLSGLPILAFGVMAIPAGEMVRRWGGWLVVTGGLALATLGELARALPGGVPPLFLGTALMGCGIALAQPSLLAMLPSWFGGRVQAASVTLTLGISVGEVLSAGISRPVLYGGLHSWRATMVVWGLAGLSCLLIWVLRVTPLRAGVAAGSRWDLGRLLGSSRLWAVYVCFGGQSLVFFSANTWIPTSVPGGPHSTLASICLAVLNGTMIPVDLVLILWRGTFATRGAFYFCSGAVTLLGTGGWFLLGSRLPILFAALIGVGVAMNFAGLLAYAPMVAQPERVAPMSAVMLTVGYACAFCGPLLGGVAIDLGGGERSPFLPIVAAALLMTLFSLRISSHLPAGLSRDSSPDAGVGADRAD